MKKMTVAVRGGLRGIKGMLAIAACLTWWASPGFAQQGEEAFLAAHQQDLTDTAVAGAVLNEEFFRHDLFLLGEAHGVGKVQQLDFDLLKLLHERAGVNTYIGEFDFAKAYYLNLYLQTGEERLLDTVFSDWVTDLAQWGNREFQQKIRNIRALNEELPRSSRIWFAGIDRVHNPQLAADFFTELASVGDMRPLFEPLIGALRVNNDSLVAAEAARIIALMPEKTTAKARRTAVYPNLVYGLQVCSEVQMPGRERALYRNFKYLYARQGWKGQKLYGLWGFAHVLQARANGGTVPSLAGLLSSDSSLGLTGKIASIACLYSGSKMMIPSQYLPPMMQDKGKRFTASAMFNNDGPMMTVKNLDAFKDASKPDRTVIFSLAEPGSPIVSEPVRITYSPFMPAQQQMQMDEAGKTIRDYFQYLVLVRNSPATTPIVE